jgi:general secretion pathway protein D
MRRLQNQCSGGIVAAILVPFVISSCSSNLAREQETLSDALSRNEIVLDQREQEGSWAGDDVSLETPPNASETAGLAPDEPTVQAFDVPTLRNGARNQPSGGGTPVPKPKSAMIETSAREISLPDLIDLAFGQLLEVPYYTGPGVAEKGNMSVILRTSGEMTSEAYLDSITDVLNSYGFAVVPEDGVYKIIEDAALRTRIPSFIRGRANFDTPAEIRPVVMFVELEAMFSSEMASILRQAFPGDDRLQIRDVPRNNSLTLNGLPDDVNSALALIEELDELSYAGTSLESYAPRFLGAKQLADQVALMMKAEGWQSSSNASVQRTILILPVEFSNQLFIFSKSEEALVRARFWLRQLDKAATSGNIEQIFVYDVQNVDASLLADTVNAVLGGGQSRSSLAGGAGGLDANNGAGAAARNNRNGQSASNTLGAGVIVVDPISNRLIYSGTASDYARVRPLLEQLDRAPGEVLINVTIAEVTLTDTTRYGVDFFLDSIGNDDFDVSLGTRDGIGLSADGFQVGFLSGNVDLALQAFAQNEQLNVLSKPKLVARSGGAARLQVGTDVPVVTSQRADNAQDGQGSLDVLQQVEYRKTGVLLTIEPIVFSQNRVDLSIAQEVSTVVEGSSGAAGSPTISNRTLDTQLSLEDGETVVLGGLIQTTNNESETGVPILKDIPVAGNLFKTNTLGQTRTELLVLITAYVLRDRDEKRQLADSLLDQIEAVSERDDNLQTMLKSNLNHLKVRTPSDSSSDE